MLNQLHKEILSKSRDNYRIIKKKDDISTNINNKVTINDNKKMFGILIRYLTDNEKFTRSLKNYVRNMNFDINTVDKYGNTLLHIVCRRRQYNYAKLLIDRYNAKINIKNADGRTPLHIAAIYGATDQIFYIIQDNKTRNMILESTNIFMKLINIKPHNIMIKDNDNMTPIDYYCIHTDINNDKNMQIFKNKYKRNLNFFDMLKEVSIDDNDYDMSINIYNLLKNSI